MSDESNTPGLRAVIDRAIAEALSSRVFLPQPGSVLSFNEATGTCSVQPLVMRVSRGEDGVRVVKRRPVLEDVPVLFIGAGARRMTNGLVAGDVGLLVPCGVSITRWQLRGGFVDPGDEVADKSDVVLIPGLSDIAHVPTTAPTDATVIHGAAKIGGPTGTQKTLMASSWQSAHDTLIAAVVSALNGIAGGSGTPVEGALTTFNAASWRTSETEVK